MHSHTNAPSAIVKENESLTTEQFEAEIDQLYRQLKTLTLSFPKTDIEETKEVAPKKTNEISLPILFTASALYNTAYLYTRETHCSELLEASIALKEMCETFRAHKKRKDRHDRIKKAQTALKEIARKYCDQENPAVENINISSESSANITQNLPHPKPSMFSNALSEIKSLLMSDAFPRLLPYLQKSAAETYHHYLCALTLGAEVQKLLDAINDYRVAHKAEKPPARTFARLHIEFDQPKKIAKKLAKELTLLQQSITSENVSIKQSELDNLRCKYHEKLVKEVSRDITPSLMKLRNDIYPVNTNLKQSLTTVRVGLALNKANDQKKTRTRKASIGSTTDSSDSATSTHSAGNSVTVTSSSNPSSPTAASNSSIASPTADTKHKRTNAHATITASFRHQLITGMEKPPRRSRSSSHDLTTVMDSIDLNTASNKSSNNKFGGGV